MKSTNRLIAALMLTLILTATGCSGGGSTGGGYGTPPADTPPSGSGTTLTVTEKGLAFDPATLEMSVGDTVTFTNEDSAPHNVSIDGQELGTQDTGASVTWTAEKAGSFPYSCTIHPSMTGEIIVK